MEVSEHPAICGYCDTSTQEGSAEAFLKTLDFFRTQASLYGVDKVTIGGCSSEKWPLIMHNAWCGDGDLIQEILSFP